MSSADTHALRAQLSDQLVTEPAADQGCVCLVAEDDGRVPGVARVARQGFPGTSNASQVMRLDPSGGGTVMRLWRIGNALLMLAVLPLVIYLLNRVLAALERIRHASDEIVASGTELVGDLEGVPDALATTDQTVRDVSAGATRYAGSVAKLLG